jgi:ATP synthase protein I
LQNQYNAPLLTVADFKRSELLATSMSNIKAPPVFKAIWLQLGVSAGLAVVVWMAYGLVSAYSILLGGLISAIPNAYFTHKAFRYSGARATGKVVREFYTGEAIKLAMTAAGFSLAFVYVEPLQQAALLIGFVVVHVTGIAALIRMQLSGRLLN